MEEHSALQHPARLFAAVTGHVQYGGRGGGRSVRGFYSVVDERQAGDYASGQGLGDVRLRSARDGRHIFTHIVWTMRCYTLECSAMPPQYRWAAPDELRTEISLPTAFRQFLDDE